MDLSKLPRMSQTPPPPPQQHDEAQSTSANPQVLDYRAGPMPLESVGAEAWISIVIGLILILAFPYTWQWLLSTISSYKPPFLPITDSTTGKEVPYAHSIFFFGHLCLFAFALALIVEGISLVLSRRPGVVLFALFVTVVATAMNLFYVFSTVLHGEAFPITSGLAVAFGGYMGFYQWKLYQLARQIRSVSPQRATL